MSGREGGKPWLSAGRKAALNEKKQKILDSRKKVKLFHSERVKDKKERTNQKVVILKKDQGIEELLKNRSARLDKIKKQTMFLIKLDKYDIRDKVEALRAFAAGQTEKVQDEGGSVGRSADIVHLQITLSKHLPKVTVKPIKVPLANPIHTAAQGGLTALIVRNNEKAIETKKEFFDKNRIKVSA